jgi:hypothetical protein
MGFNSLHGFFNTLFRQNFGADGFRVVFHGMIMDRHGDCLGQPFPGKFFPGDGFRSRPELCNPFPPILLIPKMGDDDVRHPGTQPGAGGTDASMVDNRRHLRKKPLMGDIPDRENIIRQWLT